MDLTKAEGYIFELATAVLTDKPVDDPERYTNWGKPQFSFTAPNVPIGSIRNLRAVYSEETLTLKVDATAALEAIGDTAAKLQNMQPKFVNIVFKAELPANPSQPNILTLSVINDENGLPVEFAPEHWAADGDYQVLMLQTVTPYV